MLHAALGIDDRQLAHDVGDLSLSAAGVHADRTAQRRGNPRQHFQSAQSAADGLQDKPMHVGPRPRDNRDVPVAASSRASAPSVGACAV